MVTLKERELAESDLRRRYKQLSSSLNERSRRLFVAGEVQALGHSGRAIAHRATGMSRVTISRASQNSVGSTQGANCWMFVGFLIKAITTALHVT